MPNNYILLETIALTQSAASVTFDNLPTSGYTDLKIVVSNRLNSSGANILGIKFNGVTTGYTFRFLQGEGSVAGSGNGTSTPGGWAGLTQPSTYTANTFSSNEIYIPNYRSSNFKSWSADGTTENNATLSYIELIAGLWSNTAAITSIEMIDLGGSSFLANSTFSLYGIAALGTNPVLAPKATGGNIVANDGTYWYHAFTSSGSFVPQVGLTADVLQIGGGGGGGRYVGGGGGAGGYQVFTSQSLANATNYACTIGAGGAGGTPTATGSNGTSSQFGALTASIGGGGGGSYGSVGNNGASGGGGTAATGFTAGGTGTQGFNGGAGGGVSNNYPGGGGGGAGAAGQAGISDTTGGAGGAGKNSESAWATATNTGVSGFYAGGGGGGVYDQIAGAGGAGGSGGGGAAGAKGGNNSGAPGVANTGSGAGGSSGTAANPKADGSTGGSGIIIIRYPIN